MNLPPALLEAMAAASMECQSRHYKWATFSQEVRLDYCRRIAAAMDAAARAGYCLIAVEDLKCAADFLEAHGRRAKNPIAKSQNYARAGRLRQAAGEAT